MGKSLSKIALQLKNSGKKVQLIYAFNGTGKTRLSREFKQLIASNGYNENDSLESEQKKFLYYNAFTEDLFYWNNDLVLDTEPKLTIQPNSFTKWVLEEEGQDKNIISIFQHYTHKHLTPTFSEDFSEVSFTLQRGDDLNSEKLKISKGEESCFIWSLFYSLLEQVINVLNVTDPEERETNRFNQLEYVFIDDPVSSLDENHLIELAVHLAKLIKSCKSNLKFIISTHNPLFYNVFYNETGAKGGYILRRLEDGTFEMEEKRGDSNHSFSYHLFLKHTLEQAIQKNALQKYHFTLLRNLYEKTATFLGYPQWSNLLPGDKQLYLQRIINFTSHSSLSNEAVAEPTEPEKQIIKFLLDNLIKNYNFWKQVETND